MLPAPDRLGHRLAVEPGRTCTSTALTLRLLACEACIASSSPGTPGRFKRRVGRRARALVQDRVVVLQELRLLGVLQRDEDHRVAARGHHALGQAHHGVIVAPDADAVAELEAGAHVGHRLVVAARDVAAGHQVARLTRLARLEAHHHGAHVAVHRRAPASSGR